MHSELVNYMSNGVELSEICADSSFPTAVSIDPDLRCLSIQIGLFCKKNQREQKVLYQVPKRC